VQDAHSNVFAINGQTYTAVVTKNVVSVCSTVVSSGAVAQTLPGGLVASYGSNGLNIRSSSKLTITHQASKAGLAAAGISTLFDTTLTIAGETIIVSECPTPSGAIAVGTATLTVGGPTLTLANGEVISRATDGLVFSLSTSVALDQSEENKNGASATASTDSSGQIVSGGSILSAKSGGSQASLSGTSRNTGTSASIQRASSTSKSAGSRNVLSLSLVVLAFVAMCLALG